MNERAGDIEMNERELTAYLAGLFDAEGSVFVQKKKPSWNNKTVRYVLTVTINNTRIELIKTAHKRFGGHMIGPIHLKEENTRPFYRWQVEGGVARDFLREVEPYLIVKCDLLGLVYALQDRIENYHHKPIDPNELQAREAIYQRLRRMKGSISEDLEGSVG